ncbi:Uncharacterised protein [BD1-7 clade bacterium]|uniref:Uncharacterized protein n=1 Tax=BD1-7 clade bacterium TaxID=2029982 RepID=A0A5S9Q884_9GAMM|nr:Uncharacterised protein [BD1-7 clade bacterium]
MEITLTLTPGKLSNPDADLRYTIPEMVEKLSNNKMKDNGFDYDDEDNMVIFLSSESLDQEQAIDSVKVVCKNLQLETEAIKIEASV